MSAPFRDMRLSGAFGVTLIEADDFEFWRDQARALVQCDVPPDRVAWIEPGGARDLFSGGRRRLPSPRADAPPVRASRAFVDLAKSGDQTAFREMLSLPRKTKYHSRMERGLIAFLDAAPAAETRRAA